MWYIDHFPIHLKDSNPKANPILKRKEGLLQHDSEENDPYI